MDQTNVSFIADLSRSEWVGLKVFLHLIKEGLWVRCGLGGPDWKESTYLFLISKLVIDRRLL